MTGPTSADYSLCPHSLILSWNLHTKNNKLCNQKASIIQDLKRRNNGLARNSLSWLCLSSPQKYKPTKVITISKQPQMVSSHDKKWRNEKDCITLVVYHIAKYHHAFKRGWVLWRDHFKIQYETGKSNCNAKDSRRRKQSNWIESLWINQESSPHDVTVCASAAT